jgi:hypothetical protein
VIINIPVDLERLAVEKKSYKWKRPGSCSRCQSSKIWGHGFALTYLAGFVNGLYLKRYRCMNCLKIILFRPTGYWKHYQHSIEAIYQALKYKLSHKPWLPQVSRQLGTHWLKRFNSYLHMNFPQTLDPIEVLDYQYSHQVCFFL